MKGIVFNNEWEAKHWDWDNNDLNADVTKYKWSHKPLIETTTITKAQYAQFTNIPETIVIDDEGTTVPNPKYTNLQSTYTVHEYAVIVNDDLQVVDEETGEVTEPEEVIDVSELLYTPTATE